MHATLLARASEGLGHVSRACPGASGHVPLDMSDRTALGAHARAGRASSSSVQRAGQGGEADHRAARARSGDDLGVGVDAGPGGQHELEVGAQGERRSATCSSALWRSSWATSSGGDLLAAGVLALERGEASSRCGSASTRHCGGLFGHVNGERAVDAGDVVDRDRLAHALGPDLEAAAGVQPVAESLRGRSGDQDLAADRCSSRSAR